MSPPRRYRRRWSVSNAVNNNGGDDDNHIQLPHVNNGGGGGDDSDIQLQEVLFNSAQVQLLKSKSKSNPNDVKKKGIDMSPNFVETYTGRINRRNSEYETGEPSCVYCNICNEPRPTKSDTIKRSPCGHVYCEDCVINYVREWIKETLTEVKCPVSDCKRLLLINEYFVPSEFIEQWRDTVREAKALLSYNIIECPFLGCSGYLVDDHKGFLIRTCPKCWGLFCVMCRDYWHKGMDCKTNYQWKRKIRSLIDTKNSDDDDDDDDEGDDHEESNLLSLLSAHLKNF